MTDASDDGGLLPKVTPTLVRSGVQMCPRRLHAEFVGLPGSDDPVTRARLREPFLDAVRVAHANGGRPDLEAFRVPGHLEQEEQRVFARAARGYLDLYGEREVVTVLHDCERPTELTARAVRVGGWVDFTGLGPDGVPELRQLDLWGGRTPRGSDPLELESVWLAVLRLAPWFAGRAVLVSWADPLRGERRERVVSPDEVPDLEQRLDHALAAIRDHVDPGVAVLGRDCGSCRHLARCPEHPDVRALVSGWRGDFRPGVMRLTPTGLEQWGRCRRAWRNDLLSIPASDRMTAGFHGQHTHDVLRLVHEQGSCHDRHHVEDVVLANGGDDRLRAELERHRQRCPSPAETLGHERTLARYRRGPGRPFLATARFDALWVHDGVLDARDYKTGAVATARVADDVRAQLQAWVLAPIALGRGLRLHLRYEHLAAEVDEDPEPWEPEPEELTAVETRLRSTVEEMYGEREWRGIAEEPVCRLCRYRSICPDAATTDGTAPETSATPVAIGPA